MVGSSTDRDWRSLAEETANRLRLIQADVADEAGEVRSEMIADEIDRAVSTLIPDDRERFLGYLEDRFPHWESGGAAPARAAESGQASAKSVSATDMKEFNDPSYLLRRLCQLAGTMSSEQKFAAAKELRKHGISAAVEGGMPPEALDALRASLKLRDQEQISPENALEFIGLAVEHVLNQDQLAWRVWKDLAPKSLVRRRADLRQTLIRFITGDGDVGKDLVIEDLSKLRQLSAALISSTGQAAEVMSQQMSRLHPGSIESLARPEKKALESIDVACWRKYRELAEPLDSESVRLEVKRAVGEFTERMMRTRAR